jgi:hypothetical protein
MKDIIALRYNFVYPNGQFFNNDIFSIKRVLLNVPLYIENFSKEDNACVPFKRENVVLKFKANCAIIRVQEFNQICFNPKFKSENDVEKHIMLSHYPPWNGIFNKKSTFTDNMKTLESNLSIIVKMTINSLFNLEEPEKVLISKIKQSKPRFVSMGLSDSVTNLVQEENNAEITMDYSQRPVRQATNYNHYVFGDYFTPNSQPDSSILL